MFPVHARAGDESAEDPAAFWFARMNSGADPSPEDDVAFRRWLEEDPDNIRAYHACQQAWRMLELDAGEPEMLTRRGAALGGRRRIDRRRALFGLTGGAIAAACGGIWVMTASSPARAMISTGPGQRLTAPLPDGSEVTLAPSTRLRLDFVGGRRAAELETGQAYFTILADPDSPFVVRAGERTMTTAHGRFQLTHLEDRSDVVVEQGQVQVAARRDPANGVRLDSGERTELLGGEIKAVGADVEVETAWRLGRLVVRDRPLREVVEAFNRYSPDRLVLQDRAAGEKRVSGSFRYDSAREFVLALETGLELDVARKPDGIWTIRTPDEKPKL